MLANEARVVVDAQVHSTSEQAALAPQIERLDGTQTKELLLDAGFNTYENLESALARARAPSIASCLTMSAITVLNRAPNHARSQPKRCMSSSGRISRP